MFLVYALEENVWFSNVKMLILGQETNLCFFSKSTSCSQGRFWRIMLYIWCFTYKLLCRDLFRFFIFFLSEDAISKPFKIKSEHVVNVHSAILTSFLLKMDNLTSFLLSISELYSSKSKLKLEISEKKYETSNNKTCTCIHVHHFQKQHVLLCDSHMIRTL